VDQIKQMLDTLTDLSDDQVAELQSAIVGEFETVEKEEPTPQTVDAMTSLADMLDTVRGEVQRREAAAEELTARAAEAASRVQDATAEQPEGDMSGDNKEEGAMEKPADAETPEADVTEPAESNPAEASSAAEEGSELSATDDTAVTAEAELAVEEVNPVEKTPTEEPTPESVPEEETEPEAPNTPSIAQDEQKEQEAPVTAAAE
jgi:hypothetical protein